ncbi:hypothetical protein GCM10027565_35650 [Bordetella tumulicola]
MSVTRACNVGTALIASLGVAAGGVAVGVALGVVVGVVVVAEPVFVPAPVVALGDDGHGMTTDGTESRCTGVGRGCAPTGTLASMPHIATPPSH